ISSTLNIIPAYLTILHNALPQNYNYIVNSFEAVQPYSFLGTQTELFKLNFRINTRTVE
ncbi:3733_t:CDS:1, partial [Scutellospora calospora]